MSERVQSVDRVFGLLECLADGGGSLTLSELAGRSGLPMPTIHRLVRSLVSQGYVRQEPSKRYAIGPRMIRLGESASRMLGSWSLPYLAGLVEQFGETANMAMLEGDACVYVAQVPSPQSMRMFTEVGRFVMPHSTGVGKAMLSTLSDDEVRALLKSDRHAAAHRAHDHRSGADDRRPRDRPPGRVRDRRRRAGTGCPLCRGADPRTCRSAPHCRSPARAAGSPWSRSG